MASRKRSQTGRYSVTQEYIMTRGKALHFPYNTFFKTEPNPDLVYGVVIDMPMNPTLLTTMVCFINGAANLYFNVGGDYSGAAQRYPALVQAARTLVVNASKYLGACEKVRQFDLPTGRTHYIHLLTSGGIYKLQIQPNAIPEDDQARRTLYLLYQRVLQELRLSQMKDQSNGIRPQS